MKKHRPGAAVSHYPTTEQQKQSAYVAWLFCIAESRACIKRQGTLDELRAINDRAAEIMSGISVKWLERFQARSDYAERIKQALGEDLALKTLQYLKAMAALIEP